MIVDDAASSDPLLIFSYLVSTTQQQYLNGEVTPSEYIGYYSFYTKYTVHVIIIKLTGCASHCNSQTRENN